MRLTIFAALLLLPLAAQAAPSQTLAMPGLSQPVEIIRDRWGVAHIYAKDGARPVLRPRL